MHSEGVIQRPGRRLRLPAVLQERYVDASSLLNGSRAFSFMGGTSLGGLLVQLLSGPGALIADAASFIFSALTLRSISPEEPPTEPAERGHLKAGARYLWRSPVT